MNRTIAVVAAAAIAATALATAGSASAATSAARTTSQATAQAVPVTPSTIDWGPCDDPTLQEVGAVCGMLAVPLDYAKPHGQKIHLAVSMVRHTVPDSQYQGISLAPSFSGRPSV